MSNIRDWRPIVRRVFAGIWAYVGILVAWAAVAAAGPEWVPGVAWAAVWVPFQWLAWACGAWFLFVTGAWGYLVAADAAQRARGWVGGQLRRLTRQAPPVSVVEPTMVLPALPAPQDLPAPTLAQLVYDHMLTRPVHGGRAQELLDEMREAGLFAIAGVVEPADAADLSTRLDAEGWPKLPDKRRPGYPGMATGFRHVEQIEFGDVAFHYTPLSTPLTGP